MQFLSPVLSEMTIHCQHGSVFALNKPLHKLNNFAKSIFPNLFCINFKFIFCGKNRENILKFGRTEKTIRFDQVTKIVHKFKVYPHMMICVKKHKVIAVTLVTLFSSDKT